MRGGSRAHNLQRLLDAANGLETVEVTGVILDLRGVEQHGLFHTALGRRPVPLEKILEHTIREERVWQCLVTIERCPYMFPRLGEMTQGLTEQVPEAKMRVGKPGV